MKRIKRINPKEIRRTKRTTTQQELLKINLAEAEYTRPNDSSTGRNTKYNSDIYPKQAYYLCKNLGLTQEQLGEVFDVSMKQIQRWMDKYPIFNGSVVMGTDENTLEQVEKVYINRCLGYDYNEDEYEPEVKIIQSKPDKDGVIVKEFRLTGEMILKKRVVKHMAAHTGACEFYMVNRSKEDEKGKKRWQYLKNIEINKNTTTTETKILGLKLSVEDAKKIAMNGGGVDALVKYRQLITDADRDSSIPA